MEDGRIFYIEIDGYDEKPELKILIGVDIFVNERGEILAEIPNRNKENFRDFQPNRDDNDEEIDLEVNINHSLLENSEIEFKVSALNKKGKAEDVWVNTYFSNGYQILDVTNELGEQPQELIKWKESNYSEWSVGTLEQDEERIMLIKAKKLPDKDEKGLYRNFNFKAKILSYYNKERNMRNNNKIFGNRVFVIKTSEKSFDSGVPSAGISKKTRDETEKFIIDNRNNHSVFTQECIAYKNSIEIHSEKSTRAEMVKVVEQDDGSRGTKEKNNKEYGGAINKKGEVYNIAEGPVMDLSKDYFAYVEITRYIGDSTFHSHPSGELFEDANKLYSSVGASSTISFGGNTHNGPKRYANAPSYKIEATISGKKTIIGDIGSIQNDEDKEIIKYVFARRNKKVYIYNYTGVLATLPHDCFVNFKERG